MVLPITLRLKYSSVLRVRDSIPKKLPPIRVINIEEQMTNQKNYLPGATALVRTFSFLLGTSCTRSQVQKC